MNPEIKRHLQAAVDYSYGDGAHAIGSAAGHFFRVMELSEQEYERGQRDYLGQFRITSQTLVNAGWDPEPEKVHVSQAERPEPGEDR